MDEGQIDLSEVLTNPATPSLSAALAARAALGPMLAESTVGALSSQAAVMRSTEAQLRQQAIDAGTVTGDLLAGMKWAQDAMQASMKKLEGDVQDPTSLKAKSLEEFVIRSKEASAQLEEIKQKKSVGFFDNPLEFINNQMDMPKLVENYNLTATQGNAALSTVNAIDTTLTNEAAAAKATMRTLTDGSIAAQTRMAANQYTLAANEAEYKALGSQISANQVIDHGSATQVQALMESYKITQDAKSMEIREQELQISKARLEEYIQGKKDTADGKALLRKQLTLGMAALGMPNPSDGRLNELEVLYKTPEGRKQLDTILSRGAAYLVEGRATTGDTPADSYYNLARVGTAGLKGKELEPVVTELNKVVQDIKKSHPDFDIRKPELAKPIVNEAVADAAKRWNNDPENSALFKAPPVETMALNDYVKNTKWFQTLLAPSVVAAQKAGGNVPPVSASVLYQQTIDAINDGKLSVEEGIGGLATYYKIATMKNTIKVAPVGMPKQTGYPVAIGSRLGGYDHLDMSDYAQVSQAVLQDFRIQFYDIFPGAKYQRPDAIYKDQ